MNGGTVDPDNVVRSRTIPNLNHKMYVIKDIKRDFAFYALLI